LTRNQNLGKTDHQKDEVIIQ